ncbi:MAG: MarR family transcriptional regulator [Candidatus Pacearchaeota archaeon]
MENKSVGYIVLGIAVLLIIIVALFNSTLKEIVEVGCEVGHGISCPMYDSINKQTYLSLGIVGFLIILGIVLIFTKPKEKIIVRKVKEKKKKLDVGKLDKKEKQIIEILGDENGAMFQSELKEKLDVGKVGLTRLLDKLEAKQLIERKRRGMNNIVVLKS